eukprot:COSAG06_NODE_35247_length_462_cov_1.044077_1_plen_115_part_10
MSQRSSRGSVGTAGPDDNGDAAWAAEMHERQHVPLPDGIALPAGTQLFVSRRDARKYSEADREGGPVTVMQNVAADVSHKFTTCSRWAVSEWPPHLQPPLGLADFGPRNTLHVL